MIVMYRNTYVNIDNQALTDNVKKITTHYKNYQYFIGVVKANAYGHGIYIVNDLIKGGINYLAVSSLDEALEIRKYNQDIPILVLEPIDLKYLNIAETNHITITIDSLIYTKELLKNKFQNIKIHLKLDTGMNRLGFKNKEELEEAVSLLKKNNSLEIEGIYTHLATSGYNDKYYDKQIAKFMYLTTNIDLSSIKIVHLNRSITLSNHTMLPFETGTRLGIIMYGFNQCLKAPIGLRKIKYNIINQLNHISKTSPTNNFKLKEAYSLYTEVMSIRKVSKGEFIGYGASYKVTKDEYIATLPIGYADGINENFKYVYINNLPYKIVGTICMDMTEVLIDDTINIHDLVEIIGPNQNIRKVSRNLNTNAYHVLTMITSRVPRKYLDNKIIKY